jgi:20S proteasome alpha/beta subunit
MHRCVHLAVVSFVLDSFNITITIMCSAMIMLGWDNELSQACIYKIDPAGYYRQMYGCSIGVKQQQATTILEKKIKKNKLLTYDETVEVSVSAFIIHLYLYIFVGCNSDITTGNGFRLACS